MHKRIDRRTGKARILLGALALLGVAGCSGGDSSTGQGSENGQNSPRAATPRTASSSPPPVITTAKSTSGTNLKVEINRLSADSSGFTVLRWTLTNTGGERFQPAERYGTTRYTDRAIGGWYDGEAAPGVELVSKQEGQRYFSLVDADGTCLCARITTERHFMAPEESATFFNTYYLPPELQRVTVEIPGFEPIQDVPIEHP